MVNKRDQKAMKIIEKLMKEEPDELIDSLYHYMKAYMNNSFDRILFQDEIENLIGIRNHIDIINYIIGGGD